MTNLSPAAQAVLDAAATSEPGIYATIAAALRAAADQVVPEDYDPPRSSYPEAQAFVDGKCCRNEDVRDALLAIAAELDQTDP